MGAYKDLKSIMNNIILCETCLKDFYDVAEVAMKNDKSKEMIKLLRSKHMDSLTIIKDTDLEVYGKDEWIKIVPEYKIKELIPIHKITRDSDPIEICNRILEYEEKSTEIYKLISEKLVGRGGKELFDSLITFKDMQVFEIKKLVEYINYL